MSTLSKYVLLQIPGSLFVLVVGVLLYRAGWIPLWAVAFLVAANVAKDAILYPFLKSAYEFRRIPTGAPALHGETGRVSSEITLHGQVVVQGEIWQARVADDEPPIPVGTTVKVVGNEGHRLLVARVRDPLP